MKKRFSAFALAVSIIISMFSLLAPVSAVSVTTNNVPSLKQSEVAGDATGDGEVSTQDVLLIRKCLASLEDESALVIDNADVTNDGEADIRDVLKIRKYLAGIEVSLSELFCVMTYNVGFWYNGSGMMLPDNEYEKYLSLHESIIDRYSPDVLCIQEYCDELSPGKNTIENLLGTRYSSIETDKGIPVYYNYVGKAICTNKKMINADNSLFEENGFLDSPNYEKAYIYLNGRKVCVISAHLAVNSYLVMSEMKVLAKAVENEPYFIICADINIDVSNKSSFDAVKGVFDSFSVDCNISNGGEYGTFTTYPSSGKALDNIITSSNIYIQSVTVDTQKDVLLERNGNNIIDDRDHYPLIAYLYVD